LPVPGREYLNAIVFVACKNFCYFEIVVKESLIAISFNLTLCRIMYVNFTEPYRSSEVCSVSIIQSILALGRTPVTSVHIQQTAAAPCP